MYTRITQWAESKRNQATPPDNRTLVSMTSPNPTCRQASKSVAEPRASFAR